MGENELLELHKIPVLFEDVAVDLWICDSQITSSSPRGISGLLFDDFSDLLYFPYWKNYCSLESPMSNFFKEITTGSWASFKTF